MNKTSFYLFPLLCIPSLTSCWPEKSRGTAEITAFDQVKSTQTSNIIDFSTIVTRDQNSQDVFKKLIDKHKNVVVDYYADWCGPCKIMGSTLSQIAPEFKNVTFIKINIDQFGALATGIKSIPTLIIYKNGTQINRLTGAQSAADFKNTLSKTYAS